MVVIFAFAIQKRNLLWDDLLTSLQSKMVEPMSNYISRFPEVKVCNVFSGIARTPQGALGLGWK